MVVWTQVLEPPCFRMSSVSGMLSTLVGGSDQGKPFWKTVWFGSLIAQDSFQDYFYVSGLAEATVVIV